MSLRAAGSRFLNNFKTNPNGDFYSCVKWPLMIYRYFGLFPVCLKKQNENSFAFTWKSKYLIFISIPVIISQGVVFGFYLWDFLRNGVLFPGTSLTINYTCGFMATLFLLKLAKDFRIMFKMIQAIEGNIPPIKKNILVVRYIPVILIMGCIASFVQCALNVVYLNHMAANCAPLYDDGPLKTYLRHVFRIIFQYVELNYVAAIVFQVVKFQHVFMQTLNDVFLIACSVYLENRFNCLNDIIIAEQEKDNNAVPMDWRKIQDHYEQLTKLVKVIDKRINPIVFVAFFIDLFNSCVHFFYVITKRSFTSITGYESCMTLHSDDVQTKYFKPFVALFVLFKTVTVSLICARLYTSSRKPLNGLHSISQAAYNDDTQRFMEQVYHSHVALSGFEFFFITKEMILTVLRILVTYELVLLQFKK